VFYIRGNSFFIRGDSCIYEDTLSPIKERGSVALALRNEPYLKNTIFLMGYTMVLGVIYENAYGITQAFLGYL
jgi:hypothetical protein